MSNKKNDFAFMFKSTNNGNSPVSGNTKFIEINGVKKEFKSFRDLWDFLQKFKIITNKEEFIVPDYSLETYELVTLLGENNPWSENNWNSIYRQFPLRVGYFQESEIKE